ncbi:MAG: c-type cytochrome [Rhodocyclales bacterium]|nr:c-type cytochrome [Rhodocyclales bacterium]
MGLLLLALAGATPARAQVDAEAAQELARNNECFKCHAIDKKKKGPAYTRIAARLKTKPDGVETVIQHITSGPLIELEDGKHENHRIIDTKDPKELRNLAEWILSL